ncbi:MAG: DUF424 family protein [Crenarchaeota archaeon]|nr:DUF424 family protein [Thermoproteota archaeon]
MRFRVYAAEFHGEDAYGVRVVYISDEDVVGRIERDDEKGIILRVPEILLKGELVDESEAIAAIREADVVVLYGRRIIEVAVELGFVAEESVLEVNGLRHVQIFKFSD